MSQPADSDAGSGSKRTRNRTISGLSIEQLARKRANDRRSQRASRARTRERIQLLERELANLRNLDPESVEGDENGAIESLIRRNQQLEIELVRLRSATGSSAPPPRPALDPDLGTATAPPGVAVTGTETPVLHMGRGGRPDVPTSYLQGAGASSSICADMDNHLTAEVGSAEAAATASFGPGVILNDSMHSYHQMPPPAGVYATAAGVPGATPALNPNNANTIYLPQSHGYTTTTATTAHGAVGSNVVPLPSDPAAPSHAHDATLHGRHLPHYHHQSNFGQYSHQHAYPGVDVLGGSGSHSRGGDCFDSTADAPWGMDDTSNDTQ